MRIVFIPLFAATDLIGITVGYSIEFQISDQFFVGSEVAMNWVIPTYSYEGGWG